MKRNKKLWQWLAGLTVAGMVLGFFVNRYLHGPEVPIIRSEWETRAYHADSIQRINPNSPEELEMGLHTSLRLRNGHGMTLFPLNIRDDVELMCRVDHNWGKFGARATYKPWATRKAFRDSVAKAFVATIWDINYLAWDYNGGPHAEEYREELYKTQAKWFDRWNWRVWARFLLPLVMSLIAFLVTSVAVAAVSAPFIFALLLMLVLAVGGRSKVSSPAPDDTTKVVQLVTHPSGGASPHHGPVTVDAVESDPTTGWLVVLAMFAVVVATDVRRQIRTIIVRGSRAPPNRRCMMKSSFAMMMLTLCVAMVMVSVVPATAAEVDLWFGEWNTGRGGALIYISDLSAGRYTSIASVTLSGSAFEELVQGHFNYGPLTITPAVASGNTNQPEGARMFLGGEFGASLKHGRYALSGNYANRWSKQCRFYDLVCVNLDATWSSRYSTRLGYQPVRYATPEWDHRVMFRVSRAMWNFRLGSEMRMSIAHPHRLSGMVMVSKDLGQ